MRGILRTAIVVMVALAGLGGTARAQRTVCDSPCKFILLPLPVPRSSPVPNSNPLRELQDSMNARDAIKQLRPPFIVKQLSAADMPVGAATLLEYQVDKPAAPDRGNIAPVYPDSLKRAKVNGEVVAKFIVDTTGRVKTESIEILSSTSQLFTLAVREALQRMKFFTG